MMLYESLSLVVVESKLLTTTSRSLLPGIVWNIRSPYCLSVTSSQSRAGAKLNTCFTSDRRAPCSVKVIRILRQLVGLPIDYGQIRKIEAVFSKNLIFSAIKPIF